ncbi:MAG: transposase family protein, partial [Gemmataceae bacterium]|nr:transposase family protein [Gemmataceae bacterium]
MLIAPFRNSVTMSAWQKSSACSTSTASPASSLSPLSEGYLGIIAPSSSGCDGVKKKTVCGVCGEVQFRHYDKRPRQVRDLSCGDRRVYLVYEGRRIDCS